MYMQIIKLDNEYFLGFHGSVAQWTKNIDYALPLLPEDIKVLTKPSMLGKCNIELIDTKHIC